MWNVIFKNSSAHYVWGRELNSCMLLLTKCHYCFFLLQVRLSLDVPGFPRSQSSHLRAVLGILLPLIWRSNSSYYCLYSYRYSGQICTEGKSRAPLLHSPACTYLAHFWSDLQIFIQPLSQQFWKQARQNYTSLMTLTDALNMCLSHMVLLSFGSNLYFICLQLFNSVK